MKTGPLGPGACAAALSLALFALTSPAGAQEVPDDPGAPSVPQQAATAANPSPAPTEANASPAGSGGSNTGAAYTLRVRELGRRTDELKEQVYRSKARLNLLKEMVLHQGSSVSRAVIVHRDEMGATYSLVRLVYALDGAEIFAKADESGKLGATKEFEIFNGALVPGSHTLSVVMVYQGNGFGVFSYLKGYKFTVKGSHTFTATEGKQLQLKVVGFEKGNPITTDPKDRPAIDFRINFVADKPSGDAKPAEPSAGSRGSKPTGGPASEGLK